MLNKKISKWVSGDEEMTVGSNVFKGCCKMKRIFIILQATIFQENYVIGKGSSSY